jgi:hypothetical protein
MAHRRERWGPVSSDPNIPALPVLNNASSPKRRPANGGSLLNRSPFAMPHSGDSRPAMSGCVVIIPSSAPNPTISRLSRCSCTRGYRLMTPQKDARHAAAIAASVSCTDVLTVDMQLTRRKCGLAVRVTTTRYRNGCAVPVRGACAPNVGRSDPSVSPSLASVHSLYTQFRIRSTACPHHGAAAPRRPAPRVSALWGRHRFMTSGVVSESTPMSRPPGLIHNGSVTPANSLWWPSGPFRRRCSDRQVQRLISTQTGTISWRHTPRVSPQVTGNGRSRCGDREQAVRC